MKQEIEQLKCELCGKKLDDWYRCYNKYFCCYEHLNKWEKENIKDDISINN